MGRTRFSGPIKSTAGFEVGPEGSEVSTSILNVKLTDLSTAGSVFVVSPWAGTISKIYTTIANAITTANATITPKIAGTAMTGGAITVAFTGSAAGDVDSSAPTALNTVTAGQAIEIATDGGSTVACETVVTIVINPA